MKLTTTIGVGLKIIGAILIFAAIDGFLIIGAQVAPLIVLCLGIWIFIKGSQSVRQMVPALQSKQFRRLSTDNYGNRI